MLQSCNRVQHLQLHVERQTRGKALNIHLVRPKTAWLDEELMAGLVRKAVDLRFDRRAVARADGFDHAVEKRAAVMIGADDLMRMLIGVGQIADGAVFRRRLGAEGEGRRMLVARLKLHAGKVDAPADDARRRAGLEAAQPQAHLPQAVGQTDGGLHPVRAGGNGAVADDDARIEIGARRNHDRAHAVDRAEARRYGADRAVFVKSDLCHHGLHQLKALLPLQRVLHVLLVFPAVGLRAQRVDGGAFAAVEHPVLDAG